MKAWCELCACEEQEWEIIRQQGLAMRVCGTCYAQCFAGYSATALTKKAEQMYYNEWGYDTGTSWEHLDSEFHAAVTQLTDVHTSTHVELEKTEEELTPVEVRPFAEVSPHLPPPPVQFFATHVVVPESTTTPA